MQPATLALRSVFADNHPRVFTSQAVCTASAAERFIVSAAIPVVVLTPVLPTLPALALAGGVAALVALDGIAVEPSVHQGRIKGQCHAAHTRALIITEEGTGNVCWYPFESVGAASAEFKKWRSSRLLFDLSQSGTIQEIERAGLRLPHNTIRRGLHILLCEVMHELKKTDDIVDEENHANLSLGYDKECQQERELVAEML